MTDTNTLTPGEAHTLSEIAFNAMLAVQSSGSRKSRNGQPTNWRKVYAYIQRRWGHVS